MTRGRGGGAEGRDHRAPPAGGGTGTAAIDAHVDGVDGAPAAHRWTPRPAHSRAGPAPLSEVTAHRVADPDHWHLVTYGLSDLDADDLLTDAAPSVAAGGGVSGWGFELTLRIAGTAEEPLWAVELLTNLAAYVWSAGLPFAPGHHVDLRGPIRLGTSTALSAAAVVADPTLGVLDDPFGSVEFLQIVALTADELELCRSWHTDAVIDLLSDGDPLHVCRLERPSLLDDPATAGEIAARAGSDGSELTELRVATLSCRPGRAGRGAVMEIGAGAAAALGPALRRELVGPGATFGVVGGDGSVVFTVASAAGWRITGSDLLIDVSADDVDALASLFDGRTGWGRHRALPGLRVHVVA